MNARHWRLLIAVGLGMLLNPLNSSMVAVAIPRLEDAFQRGLTVITWIIFSFYIASAIANPVVGKASDLFGRKKVFLAGLLVALAASLSAPFSPSFGWLIAFRVLQSIGTSMLISVGMAVIRIHVREKQATALSVLTVFQSGAAALGPFIGGVLIHWQSWPAIFYVNVPFVAVSFLLCRKAIPADEPPSSSVRGLSVRGWWSWLDGTGILLFAAGLIPLLIGLLSFESAGSPSFVPILEALGGLALLAAFVRRELRAKSPFLPLRALAQYPSLTRVNVEFMAVNALFYALFFSIPSYLQTIRHVGEMQTGVLMLTLGLCSLIASPIAGRWVDRSGPKPALRLAAILLALGSAWVATWDREMPVIGVCLALAAFGIGNGLNSVGMQSALFKSAPKDIIGVASGLFGMSRNVGAILSSLLIGIVMGERFGFEGFRWLGIILTVIALSLAAAGWRRPAPLTRRRSETEPLPIRTEQ